MIAFALITTSCEEEEYGVKEGDEDTQKTPAAMTVPEDFDPYEIEVIDGTIHLDDREEFLGLWDYLTTETEGKEDWDDWENEIGFYSLRSKYRDLNGMPESERDDEEDSLFVRPVGDVLTSTILDKNSEIVLNDTLWNVDKRFDKQINLYDANTGEHLETRSVDIDVTTNWNEGEGGEEPEFSTSSSHNCPECWECNRDIDLTENKYYYSANEQKWILLRLSIVENTTLFFDFIRSFTVEGYRYEFSSWFYLPAPAYYLKIDENGLCHEFTDDPGETQSMEPIFPKEEWYSHYVSWQSFDGDGWVTDHCINGELYLRDDCSTWNCRNAVYADLCDL